ncbi:glycosyltransferase [Actinospica sp. MGRD01-02]|uniref:Glucosyl-3-phosphoglycerate synthase n=1 Tax=Actinospica acidithermotolerans TaxID=2828514 RepID=A0A941EBR0_9ACTN|nr:glycosyltransferase [Actinospica acidithermotolerans]MBR7828616.1 glycosyltransferase [Actinospica acidithermotolerans]
MTNAAETAVIIPAYREAERIGATVDGARSLPGVDLVVVVDDGSADEGRTARIAREHGAIVVGHGRNRGKGAAMETGAAAVAAIEARERAERPRMLLFLDADLERTAANAAPLIEPVRSGEAGMTIAILPPQRSAGGGHGFVVRLAKDGIRRAVGFEATQPLSGQRCLSREVFDAALPLAHGFGAETGLTIDVLRNGVRVREVEADFQHRVTGTDFAAQVHRGRQYRDVALALGLRSVPANLRPQTWRGR